MEFFHLRERSQGIYVPSPVALGIRRGINSMALLTLSRDRRLVHFKA